MESKEEVIPQWKVFSLTYAEYPAEDLLGKGLSILSLLPLVIVISSVSIFCVKRDLHTIVYGIGMILNGILNYLLKHYIKEPRPQPPFENREAWKLFEQYGMPSSHSQFMFFWATYLTLFILYRLHNEGRRWLPWWKLPLSFLCIGLASTVSYGRIYLHYHTIEQVGWGATIGSGLALAWFTIVQLVLTPCFPWIASTRLASFFLLRDETLIPNVTWFEYSNSRQEAQRRQRKLVRTKSK